MLAVRIAFCSCCIVVLACGESTVDATSSAQVSTTGNGGAAGGGGATGGTSAGGSGSGGEAPASYRAFGYSGGLEHLTLVKRDDASDTCVRIFLAAPQETSALAITVPAEWGVVVAEMGEGASVCTAARPLVTSAQPESASGSIAWRAECPFCLPMAVDIHATLTFAEGPESLDADGIPVEPWE